MWSPNCCSIRRNTTGVAGFRQACARVFSGVSTSRGSLIARAALACRAVSRSLDRPGFFRPRVNFVPSEAACLGLTTSRLGLRDYETSARPSGTVPPCIGRCPAELVGKLFELLFKLPFLVIEPFLKDRHDPLVQVPQIIERHRVKCAARHCRPRSHAACGSNVPSD